MQNVFHRFYIIPAVLDTGAYCAAMASNYNMRGRALEIGMFGMAGLWK
jgi:hypothetical protein